jgi:uncharacterized protein YcaQ
MLLGRHVEAAMRRDTFSLGEARRMALAAQGFDRPRPVGKVAGRHIARIIRQLGLVQLDFVNVLVPSHYTIFFSRLGPYPRSLLDDVAYRGRQFTEQWAHEASIVPVETWPLLRHRMETHRVRPWGFEKFLEDNPDYAHEVLDEVRRRGPLVAETLDEPKGAENVLMHAWSRSVARATLEAHFGRGVLAVAERRPSFARAYDLAERVLPPEHHGRTVPREDAQRELLRQAARAHGVGTAADLADYWRMAVGDARPRLAELVDRGELRQVQVEGWREPAYLHRQARLPAHIEASALLSPFDPVVWFRPRTARLYGVDFRFEIFVPPLKRRWGCYVLPFLYGDRLVARVDLKADRTGRRLLVLAAYVEPGSKLGEIAGPLARELRTLATWLELDSITVERRGDFGSALRAAVRKGL